MATAILAAQEAPRYHLPEADRLAIISQSDYSRTSRLIERQRAAFIALHGDPFGLVVEEGGQA